MSGYWLDRMMENCCNNGVEPALNVDSSVEERPLIDALYLRYADGIRFHLTRRNASLAIEHSVMEVVLDASRTICRTPGMAAADHPSVLLECTRRHAAAIPYCNRETGQPNLAGRLLSRLSGSERAILSRAYVFNQPDSRIATATGRTMSEVSAIRHRARDRFRQLWGGQAVTDATVN